MRGATHRGPDHRVNWHPEALLGTVGGIVDIVPARLADNQDIYAMRRQARALVIAGRPRAEDQHLFCSVQARELLSHDLQRPPGQQQQLCQRLGQPVVRIRPHHRRASHLASPQQTRVGQAFHLAMHGTQGSMETLRQFRQAVLVIRVEKQRRQDVSLQP